MSEVDYAAMDFSMPPAPGEFVPPVPRLAPEPPPVASAAMVPVRAQIAPQLAPEPTMLQQDVPLYSGPPGPYIVAPMPMHAAPLVAPTAALGAEGADASSSLGLSLLLVVGGAIAGGIMTKGAAGALGGALLGGAAATGIRAARTATKGDEANDKKAMVDGSFAIGGAALGVYLLYKARGGESAPGEAKPNADAEPNEPEDDADDGPTEGSKMRKPAEPPHPLVKVTSLAKTKKEH